MFLKRFSYQHCYFNVIPRFARPVPQICMITNMVMSHIYYNFCTLTFRPESLSCFANAIHRKDAPMQNCWGFIDGTLCPVCRPQKTQRIIYNGHK